MSPGVRPPIPPVPILVAPMAGGPTTPELVGAIGTAGGLAFIACGTSDAATLSAQITAVRALTDGLFGVNLFVPRKPDLTRDEPDLARYRTHLMPLAARFGVTLPEVSFNQLGTWARTVKLLLRNPVPVVSFTFGTPSTNVVDALHEVGTSVFITVTRHSEAIDARDRGADAIIVQGSEAGGHRGVHSVRAAPRNTPTEAALAQCAPAGLPMIAAGGVSSPEDVRRLLDAGAVAVQCGTMFLLADEAGTNATWRAALRDPHRELCVTRAFSGRLAQGLRNSFVDRFDRLAPPVYPQVDTLTRPIREAAAAAGNPEYVSLFAGQGWRSCRQEPAADILGWLAGGGRASGGVPEDRRNEPGYLGAPEDRPADAGRAGVPESDAMTPAEGRDALDGAPAS